MAKPKSRESGRRWKAGTSVAAKSKARQVASQCGRAVKLDAIGRGRIEAHFELGRCLDQAMGNNRSRWYGRSLFKKVVAEWNRTQRPKLGLSAAKYARQMARAFDEDLLCVALDSGIGLTGLKELSRRDVTPEQRRSIVEKVRDGILIPSKVVERVRSIPGITRNMHMPGAGQAEAVLSTVMRQLRRLDKSVERLDAATLALVADASPRRIMTIHHGIVEACVLAGERLNRLKKLRNRTRRQRGRK